MVFTRTNCTFCGRGFKYPRDYGIVRYCSATCRVKHTPPTHPWEYKGCVAANYYNRRRRRKINNGDFIDPLVIYIAYDWTCHLCCDRIDRELVAPDPMAATIDHLVPLGAGGKHEWANIKPAHKKCNEDKDRNINEESFDSERSADSIS